IPAFLGLSGGRRPRPTLQSSPNNGQLITRNPWRGSDSPPSFRRLSARATQHVSRKRPQSGKPVRRIDVMLDDIKRAIVKAAEAPDCNPEQQRNLHFWMLHQEQGGGC